MDMNKYNEWPANHKGDKNPSPKIIALGKRITDVAGHMIGGVTAEDPEYWGLAEIITEEMAEVGLTMKRRAHYTFDQLCEMNKDKVAEKGKEGFQKLLDEMSYIGLLEYDYGYHYDHQWPYRTTVRKTLYTSDVRTGISRTFQHGRDSWGCQGKSKIRTASGCSFFL